MVEAYSLFRYKNKNIKKYKNIYESFIDKAMESREYHLCNRVSYRRVSVYRSNDLWRVSDWKHYRWYRYQYAALGRFGN